ncbi:hypothetical protein [Rhizobium leguminosarum]|uniref:hypothetical protein n=1 Tax=Rhizobium leguminosarum TaxID=384 RepID=UPI00098F2E5B|nr:hypothetical protein [Rhizobium leguminosarum]MBB5255994.1 hypothetical protein [Rhizobium leguminosarum]MDX6001312.1 hypothetical protein [Rhizobium leguminosarum]OOO44038.1 hypothetical protein BS629_28170 [Rhizobium leguminosarum bv. viciae USDA 2370]PUB63227.1 hypothetical protein DB728_16090 [Rhizobium leguminosarum bv. viciae USDA 2370]TCA82269.1 hypothetical protein E0H74_20905 [Rhizobium leguminosarum bv. viciae]
MQQSTNRPQATPAHAALVSIDRQVATLEKRREEMRAEMARLEAETRQVDVDLKHLRDAKRSLSLLGANPDDRPNHLGELPDVPEDFAKRRIQRPDAQAWQVRQQAYRILKDQGHPLSRIEIYDRLKALGVEIDHPTPAKRLGRILTDAKEEFVYRDNGYWIAGEPITVAAERPKRFRTRRKPKEI